MSSRVFCLLYAAHDQENDGESELTLAPAFISGDSCRMFEWSKIGLRINQDIPVSIQEGTRTKQDKLVVMGIAVKIIRVITLVLLAIL